MDYGRRRRRFHEATTRLGSHTMSGTFAATRGSFHSTVLLQEYATAAEETDRFDKNEVRPIVLGLFGEVGGIMSAVKKHKREGPAFASFRKAVEEEFGDALWYFMALCRRTGKDAQSVFAGVAKNGKYTTAIAASG